MWNAIYMVPMSFVLWPFQALIPGFGGMAVADLGPSFADGFRCYFGQDVLGAKCQHAWVSETMFSVGTFVAGCFAVVLVQVSAEGCSGCCTHMALRLQPP